MVCLPMMMFDLEIELRVPLSCLALYSMAQLVGLVRMDAAIPRCCSGWAARRCPSTSFTSS